MNWQEFEMQIEKLKEVFGVRMYPDQRVKIFWDEFKNVHVEDFEKAVDGAVAEYKYAPMLSALKESLRPVMLEMRDKRDSEFEEKLKNKICPTCTNSGVVYRKISGYEYAYQCHCEAGSYFYPNFPKCQNEPYSNA